MQRNLLSVLCVALFPFSLLAQNNIPDATPYVYIGSAGMNSTTLPTQIYTSPSTTINNFAGATPLTGSTTKVNGIGVNPNDKLIYGLAFPNAAGTNDASLFQVGADGSTTEIGQILPPAGVISLVNTTAGTVDAAGNYWFTAYSYNGFPFPAPTTGNLSVFLGRIDAVHTLAPGTGTLTVTYYQLDITDPGVNQGFQAFLDAFDFSNPGYSDGGMEDIALNPTDHKFYSYLSYPDPSNTSELIGRPVVIDLGDQKISVVGNSLNSPSANGAPNREMAGSYFDAGGNMFGVFTDGQYGQIDLTTGALFNLTQSNLPLDNGNLRGDLASNIPVAVLPVTLNSFTGEVVNQSNRLMWTVGTEQNLDRYIVEKSYDGAAFVAVGYVAAGQKAQYTFIDHTGNQSVSYYRLKMQDKNGTVKYSSVLKLAAEGYPSSTASVYPTSLTGDRLYIQTSAANTTVRLTSLNGQQLAMDHYNNIAGNSIQTFALPALKSGTYLVSIYDAGSGNLMAAQRIVKP